MNPRGAWQSAAYPVTGPGSQPAQWTMTTLHWPGGTINPDDPGGTLRAWQQSWCNSKGYSLGYNFCVFPDGSQWEVRGFDIACAANGNQQVNVPAIAINLCVPDVNTAPTAAMVEGVVDLIEQTRSRQPGALIINGHRDVRPEPTSCPGDVIYQWITQGIFEPSGYIPPAPPLVEASDMLTLFAVTDATNPTATYVSNGMMYRWLSSGDAINALIVFMTKAGLSTVVQGCSRSQIGWAGVYVDETGNPAANPFL